MWCFVVNFNDCTPMFNADLNLKTIDFQVDLDRMLTFWH